MDDIENCIVLSGNNDRVIIDDDSAERRYRLLVPDFAKREIVANVAIDYLEITLGRFAACSIEGMVCKTLVCRAEVPESNELEIYESSIQKVKATNIILFLQQSTVRELDLAGCYTLILQSSISRMSTAQCDVVTGVTTNIRQLTTNKTKVYAQGQTFIDRIDDHGYSTLSGILVGAPPLDGEFVMWKRGYDSLLDKPLIIKLLVPADAKRFGTFNVRVNMAKVLEITDLTGRIQYDVAYTPDYKNLTYKAGELLVVADFSDSISTDGNGISGYMTRELAVKNLI